MGLMLRKDDPEQSGRDSRQHPARNDQITGHQSLKNNTKYLEELAAGPGWTSSGIMPHRTRRRRRLICGFPRSTGDFQRWSQTMIDGTGNYADKPSVWASEESSKS
jgi:hypothetical protein